MAMPTVILHLPAQPPYTIDKFYEIVKSIFNQLDHNPELIILDEQNDQNIKDKISQINTEGCKVNFISGPYNTLGEWLDAAVIQSSGDMILYMDNSSAQVILKQSAIVSFSMVMERNPDCGLVYSDYEVETDGEVKEIHLLKHHIGRVRDNQDFGKVFFIKKAVLQDCGGFDSSLKFNTLYDGRLKISENSKILHLSNRYSGSLYRVMAAGKGHNVFDYLLASKESQIEAENVLSAHLKNIGAHLDASKHYMEIPETTKEAELVASIIIPVNNRPKFIGTAIESVLGQTIQRVEVIVVVNGGPDDPTIPAVQEYMTGGKKHDSGKPEVRLIVLDVNNIGMCLNVGAKGAHGKYYVQLDSDDRLKADAVAKIMEVYESDSRIGMVIGSYEVWELDDKSGKIERVDSIPVVTHDEWTEENGRNNLLRINGAGAPRSIPINVIKEIGYFGINDEPFARNYGEDYEMVLKISEKYRIGRVWDPIYDVVRHSGGTDHSIDQSTIDRNDEAKDYMREQAIQRRIKMNQ
jgi:hypothetical protein